MSLTWQQRADWEHSGEWAEILKAHSWERDDDAPKGWILLIWTVVAAISVAFSWLLIKGLIHLPDVMRKLGL